MTTTVTELSKEEISKLSHYFYFRYRKRIRMYRIQKGKCDCCKKDIHIFKCIELREKPSKHFNLVCKRCSRDVKWLIRHLLAVQKKHTTAIAYLKRKKCHHKALLRLKRMKENIATVY